MSGILPARLGSAEKAVLLKMTQPGLPLLEWNSKDGKPLYENREFTEKLLQRLVMRGYVKETHEDGHTMYRVMKQGEQVADRVRGELGIPHRTYR